jgi:hypothetical protein
VVEVCLAGVAGHDVSKAICENLKRAAAEYLAYGFDRKELLQALFKIQPRAALDAFLTGDDEENPANKNAIARTTYLHQIPLDQVSEAALFEWCGDDPAKRFPAVASLVSGFTVGRPQSIGLGSDRRDSFKNMRRRFEKKWTGDECALRRLMVVRAQSLGSAAGAARLNGDILLTRILFDLMHGGFHHLFRGESEFC